MGSVSTKPEWIGLYVVVLKLFIPRQIAASCRRLIRSFTGRKSSDAKTNNEDYKVVLSSLQPGDMVCFQRTHFWHYGIFVGGDQIIQMLRDGGSPTLSDVLRTLRGVDNSTGHIHKKDFWTTGNGSKARRDNYLDELYPPLAPEEIVRRAEAMVGQSLCYNMMEKNCEHWATWCRYDIAVSRQAEQLKEKLPNSSKRNCRAVQRQTAYEFKLPYCQAARALNWIENVLLGKGRQM